MGEGAGVGAGGAWGFPVGCSVDKWGFELGFLKDQGLAKDGRPWVSKALEVGLGMGRVGPRRQASKVAKRSGRR